MGLKTKLIIGLADEEIGSRVANALQHVTGSSNALTVGATTVLVGVTGTTVGFFGSAGAVRQQCTTNSVTALHACLSNLGLVNSTIG
jgi:hypothetical protein